MFLTIGNVLSETELADIRALLGALSWRDGAETAGARARAVKRNEQADLSGSEGQRISTLVRQGLERQSVFQAAARPSQLSNFLLSRTSEGGGYGAHVDNALMGKGPSRLRSDLSFTLFLSEPDAYEGGALNLDFAGGTQSIKLAAGDMVLYTSSIIHEVETVASGQRVVVAGWVESEVRDAQQREILFDLDRAKLGLGNSEASTAQRLLLDKVYSNLLRLWARS